MANQVLENLCRRWEEEVVGEESAKVSYRCIQPDVDLSVLLVTVQLKVGR